MVIYCLISTIFLFLISIFDREEEADGERRH